VALEMGFVVKIGLGTGIWAKFGLGNGIWIPAFRTLAKKQFQRKKNFPQKFTPLSKKFGNKMMKLQLMHFLLLKSSKERIV